ncbi:MAG: hypothetical protein ACE5HE_00285 [Phycisphaerae bacterium]
MTHNTPLQIRIYRYDAMAHHWRYVCNGDWETLETDGSLPTGQITNACADLGEGVYTAIEDAINASATEEGRQTEGAVKACGQRWQWALED